MIVNFTTLTNTNVYHLVFYQIPGHFTALEFGEIDITLTLRSERRQATNILYKAGRSIRGIDSIQLLALCLMT